MLVLVKYFYEKTDNDYLEYNNLYDLNFKRIVFFSHNLEVKYHKTNIESQIDEDKDILSVRFISDINLKNNKIITNILLGNGFVYDNNKIWYPKEVWIYR